MQKKAYYTKYRPQKFEDVLNQEVVVNFLKKSISKDMINHFYIFSGTKGTGKTTVARLFSKSLNCLSKEYPCNECKNCLEYKTNIFEIDAASNNGVDNIRSIIDKSKLVNVGVKYNIFIIDEAHMLSKSAFNAMLKTLEEPDNGNVFILATTELNRIPDTIISRALNLYFNIITQESIEKLIKKIALKEEIKIDKESIELIASMSNNAARDALINLEKSSLYCDQDITVEKISELFKVPSKKLIDEIYLNIKNKKLDNDLIKKIFEESLSVDNILESLIEYAFKDDNFILVSKLYNVFDRYKNSMKINNVLKTLFIEDNVVVQNTTEETKQIKEIKLDENKINNIKETNVDIKISIEEILDNATSQERLLWEKRWLQNTKLLKNKEFSPIIFNLLNSKIVAASNQGVIISVEKDYIVDKLQDNRLIMNKLLKYYAGFDIGFLIYSNENWIKKRKQYLEKKKEIKNTVESVFGNDLIEEI